MKLLLLVIDPGEEATHAIAKFDIGEIFQRRELFQRAMLFIRSRFANSKWALK